MRDDMYWDVGDLATRFVAANTPAYLFKHFRRDEGVRLMGHELTTREIVEALSDAASRPMLTIEDHTRCCALLVALSFKDTRELETHWQTLQRLPFRWAQELTGLLKRNTGTADSLATGTWRPVVGRADPDYSSTSDSSTVVIVEPKIHIDR